MRFSVIIPTLNRPQALKLTLKGLASQTFQDFEVLICDSTEPPVEINAADYSFPIFSFFQKSRGRGAARNFVSQHAKGEWLIFIDDHDYPATHLLEHYDRQIKSDLKKNSFAYRGSVLFVDNLDKVKSYAESLTSTVRSDQLFVTNNICIEKKVFIRLGRFSENYVLYGHEDTEFGIRYLQAGYSIAAADDAFVVNFPSGDPWWYFIDRSRQLAHTEYELNRAQRKFAKGVFKRKRFLTWLFMSKYRFDRLVFEFRKLSKDCSPEDAQRKTKLKQKISQYLYGLGVWEIYFPFGKTFNAEEYFSKFD